MGKPRNEVVVHKSGIILDAKVAAKLKGCLQVKKGRPVLSVYAGKRNGKSYQHRHQLGRYLMGLTSDDPNVVDHINRNPLDNRLCNLRVVTRGQNAQNRGASPRKHWPFDTPPIRGVTVNRYGHIKATVTMDGVAMLQRTCKTINEAVALATRVRRRQMPFSAADQQEPVSH